MRKLLSSIFCTIAFSGILAAQVPIVVNGTVKYEDGKPAGVDYSVIEPGTGKVSPGKSNPKTGAFQLSLLSGSRYDIVFKGIDILKKREEITTKPSEKYYEDKMDFTVQKLVVGSVIMAVPGFSRMSSSLSAEGNSGLDELKDLLKKNRGITVSLAVYPDERPVPQLAVNSAPAPAAQKTKGKPKKNATPPPPPPAPVQEDLVAKYAAILEQRVSALKVALADVKGVEKKVQFVAVPELPEVYNGTSPRNLVVTVSEIKNLFD